MLDANNALEILSTNTIQKDLSGIDPLLRSLALRCAVNMSNVSGLNELSIIRASLADSSVYVRKTACAVLRSFLTKTKTTPEIIEMIHRSLYDSEPSVLSSAVQTAWMIRNHFPVLPRPIFSRLVSHLPQMDHYGQFFALDLLYRYCASNFSPNSSHPDLVSFIDRVHRDILPYSSSPAIVEISITVLAELTTQTQSVWSHIVHHVSRLPCEYSARLLKLALPIMENPEFTKLCPFDQFFVRSDDTCIVASLKIKILTRFCHTAQLAHAKIILLEFLDYIARFDGVVGVECVTGIAIIGHRYSELSETVLRILLTLISDDDNVDDEITGEAISQLRQVVGTTAPSDSIIDTVRHICDKAHTFSNEKTRISALWLMTVYHDFIPLVVPNVLRAFGARIHDQSPLVKLQVCILASESLRYYTCEAKKAEKVSQRLLEPLTETVEYIFKVCGTDQVVGDAVAAMRTKAIPAGELKGCGMKEVLTTSGDLIDFNLFTNEKWGVQRPETDRIDVIDEEKGTEEKSSVRNLSSEQSSMNRTSAKVLVPSTVKPIVRLEDLDLFFSVQETVAEDEVENVKSGNAKGAETMVRATIDLTELT